MSFRMDIKVRKHGGEGRQGKKTPPRDTLPERLLPVFISRGISPDALKTFEYADMDKDGRYADIWIAFDGENLYVVTGKDRIVRRRTRSVPDLTYEVSGFELYPVKDFDSLTVERFISSARLMGVKKAAAEGEEDTCTEIVRFSLGVASRIDKFTRNYRRFKEGRA